MSSPDADSQASDHVPRSSSFAATPAYDADVRRDQMAVGPVRLPEEHSPSFIQAFNRTYEAYGLTIEPRENELRPDAASPLLDSDSTLPEGK